MKPMTCRACVCVCVCNLFSPGLLPHLCKEDTGLRARVLVLSPDCWDLGLVKWEMGGLPWSGS